jgi:hypothetical protein
MRRLTLILTSRPRVKQRPVLRVPQLLIFLLCWTRRIRNWLHRHCPRMRHYKVHRRPSLARLRTGL